MPLYRDPPPSSFTCSRCGLTSHSRRDAARGCSLCCAYTRTQAAQEEEELTPEALLRHPGWHLARADEEVAEFTFGSSRGGYPSSWALTRDLGVIYAAWTDGSLTVQVHTAVFAPLLADTLAWLPAALGHPLAARLRLADMRRPLPGTDVPGGTWYCCPACARQLQVPFGHRGGVLCGCTVPPPVMLSRRELALAEYARARGLAAAYQAQASQSFEDIGCDMERMIAALRGLDASPVSPGEMREQIARELWMLPRPEDQGQVLPEASYIPDHCPPRRALPGTEHPAEHGEDPGTAARTVLSDYDDPERAFL